MRNTKFTNREEYLAYRKQWKADYAGVSQCLRDIRYIVARLSKPVEVLEKDENYQRASKTVSVYDRNEYKVMATNMLEELKEAKIEAQNQYLKQKIQIAA